jgi:hypothetical protein
MAYEEDRKTAVLWEKIRWAALFVGVCFWVVGKATEHDLSIVAVACWLFGAVAVIIQARAQKRMGRDVGGLYFYAAMLAAIAISWLF